MWSCCCFESTAVLLDSSVILDTCQAKSDKFEPGIIWFKAAFLEYTYECYNLWHMFLLMSKYADILQNGNLMKFFNMYKVDWIFLHVFWWAGVEKLLIKCVLFWRHALTSLLESKIPNRLIGRPWCFDSKRTEQKLKKMLWLQSVCSWSWLPKQYEWALQEGWDWEVCCQLWGTQSVTYWFHISAAGYMKPPPLYKQSENLIEICTRLWCYKIISLTSLLQ